MLMARWLKATPRRCARSPTSGPLPARADPRTRTGSLSRPKLRISWYSPKLLLPLAAIVATIPLLLWWCSVHQQTIRLRPGSCAEIEGWAEDDEGAAFDALVQPRR